MAKKPSADVTRTMPKKPAKKKPAPKKVVVPRVPKAKPEPAETDEKSWYKKLYDIFGW
jgi:hypothetical protein